jgi:tetratricopeptide (TPR) repeat protein
LGSAFAGTEEFLFRHELLRDAVYGTIIKGERRGYHSRAARWYAAFAADGNDEYLAIIAGHYRLAGEDGPCLDYTKLAIARYARRFCGRAVIELAAKALPLARSDSEALELLRPKAEAHIDLGDYAGAAACLDSVEALGEIPAEAADWLVLKRLILFQRRGEQLAGLEFAHGQAARLGAIGDPASKAKYFNNLGLMLASLGRSAEAESNFRLAARWGAGGIDEAHAYNNLGNLRYSGGAYEEALEFHQMARDAYLAEGNPRNLGVSFNNIGVAYDCLQRPDEALAAYEAGLAHSAAAGDLNNLSNLLSNLDMIYFDRGMNAKALALESQSLALRRRIGNAYGIAISLANMAAIERGEGLDGAALAKYREAAEILERTGGLDIIDYVYLPIMAAALDAGDGLLFLDFQEKFFSRPGRGDLDSAAGYALALMADGLRPRDGFAGPARAGLAFLMRQGLPVEVEALFEAGKTALSQDEEWAFDALEREIAWLEGQGRGEGARAAAAAYLDRARASGKPRLIGRAERFIGERP